MFRFGDLNRVIWPVEIGDGTFRVAFEIFTRDELASRRRKGAEAVMAHLHDAGPPKTVDELAAVYEAIDQRTACNEAELLRRVKDWYDIEDPDGKPLACTPERVRALIATEYGFRAMLHALLEASREGPAKNLSPGPGGLPVRDQA